MAIRMGGGECKLQEDINYENVSRLEAYYREFLCVTFTVAQSHVLMLTRLQSSRGRQYIQQGAGGVDDRCTHATATRMLVLTLDKGKGDRGNVEKREER